MSQPMTQPIVPTPDPRDARDLRICEMLDTGYSYTEIMAETGASRSQCSEMAAVLRQIDAEDGQ